MCVVSKLLSKTSRPLALIARLLSSGIAPLPANEPTGLAFPYTGSGGSFQRLFVVGGKAAHETLRAGFPAIVEGFGGRGLAAGAKRARHGLGEVFIESPDRP